MALTDPADRQPEDERAVYRPAPGGLERGARQTGDYRDQLRSRRWNAAPLENPEVEPTEPRFVVLAIVALSAITFIVIVLGYASGFWA